MGVRALHWDPPAEAIAEAATHATEPSHCSYGPVRGPNISHSACLGAGAVHWGPPAEAIVDAAAHATHPSYSSYGPDEGMPELRAALQEKIEQDNGLTGVRT